MKKNAVVAEFFESKKMLKDLVPPKENFDKEERKICKWWLVHQMKEKNNN